MADETTPHSGETVLNQTVSDQTVSNQTVPNQTVLIVAYTWGSGSAELRTRSPESRSGLVAANGFSINYRVDDQPRWHCPGRIPFRSGQGDYVDCFGKPQRGSKVCVNCAVAEATLAGSLHHAHTRDPEQLDGDVAAHLLQPNYLYLAAFRDGSIKVGTSSAQRRDKRWLEQGAWLAVAVAETTDGIVVRRLEDLVTERLAIPQSVNARRKLSGLTSPMDDDVLNDRLKHTIADVHRLITDVGLPGVDAEEQYWANPLVGSAIVDGLKPYPADLRRDSHHFTIEAMVGRLAVIRRGGPDQATGQAIGDDRFAIDIGAVFGLELQQGDYQPIELAIQDSLF